jgi:hypothetical protein
MPGRVSSEERKRSQAIAALLRYPTIKKAAAKIEVSEKTLRTWMKSPEFIAAFDTARREALEKAVAQLHGTATDAVTALKQALRSGDEKVKVRAALGILDRGIKGSELLDVLQRLADMEKRIAEPKKRK